MPGDSHTLNKVRELRVDALYGKKKHYNAADRKAKYPLWFAPREDIDLLNSVAKDKVWFRDVIRLCKYIRTTYNFQVSSFAIETAIVPYGMSNYWFSSLAWNVYGSLSYLASAFRSGVIKDPLSFVDNNLIAGVGSLNWYADRIDRIVGGLKALGKEPDQEKVRQEVDRLFKNL